MAIGQPAVDPNFDPVTGYRIAQYRGVVADAPAGVDRITAAQVVALVRDHAILIDVTPAEGGIRDPQSGRWRLAMPHHTIRGAYWFPEAGRGALAPDIERWFVGGVDRLGGRRRDKTLIVFCLADCWMSWNAARRLKQAGFGDVRWFADGLDGWRDAGQATKRVEPYRGR
ncbi:rhodanese-like domain-containing protein [Sphingomonas crocodyli]|nr:rhodanese-like domain-containing protein [Sphingomonas crocodyli]